MNWTGSASAGTAEATKAQSCTMTASVSLQNILVSYHKKTSSHIQQVRGCSVGGESCDRTTDTGPPYIGFPFRCASDPGAELQPGLYRLRAWIACTTPQGVVTTAELLFKAPSELNLRPVTGNDLLHREG